jgi:hypothetical protein
MVRGVWWIGFVAVVAGCHQVEHDTRVPLVEEYRVAPDEERFNNPPELGFRKPPPKKEFTPGLGGPMGPGGGGGMGGPGF